MIKQSAAGLSAEKQAELAKAMGFSIDDVLEHVMTSAEQQQPQGDDLASVQIANPSAPTPSHVHQATFAIQRDPNMPMQSQNLQALHPVFTSGVQARSVEIPDTSSVLSPLSALSHSHDDSRRPSVTASVTSDTHT